MSLKDIMADDVDDIFFDENENAEPITYDGTPMLAIPNIGAYPERGNEYSQEGSAARATFEIKAALVPDPRPGAEIVHSGKAWQVAKLLQSDGLVHVLLCTGQESVFGMR